MTPVLRSALLRLAASFLLAGLIGMAVLQMLDAWSLGQWGSLGVAAIIFASLAAALGFAFVVRPLQKENLHLTTQHDKIATRLEEAQTVGRIGWWTYDIKRNQLETSEALAVILGRSLEDFPRTRQEFWKLILEEDQDEFRAALREARDSGSPSDVTFRTHVGQEIREFRHRARITRDEHGQPSFSVGTIQDVTEERKAARERSAFVSAVTHELRTPLTSIVGSLSLLNHGAAGEVPDKMRQLISKAQANSQRLSDLVDDILDSERLLAGEMQLALEPTEVESFLEEVLSANEGFGTEFGVRFRLECRASGLVVSADPARLQQVLTNLLSNAAKFSKAGGEVVVAVDVEDGQLVMSVTDHGEGIPEAYQATIFERFTQAHKQRGRNARSTGLGLNISRQIVELHGGEIDFQSKEGHGTTFYVRLPLAVSETGSSKAEPLHHQTDRQTGSQSASAGVSAYSAAKLSA